VRHLRLDHRPRVSPAPAAITESVLSKSPKEMQQERAEASFKRKEVQAREATKAMADYQAATAATREKTARLRAQRLAKEAADRVLADEEAAKPKAAKAKGTKPKAAKKRH